MKLDIEADNVLVSDVQEQYILNKYMQIITFQICKNVKWFRDGDISRIIVANVEKRITHNKIVVVRIIVDYVIQIHTNLVQKAHNVNI